MYDNYKLCETLASSEICFVVEQYNEGKFTRKFHEHMPKSRLSDNARSNVLRALVMHFSGMGAESIVRCHLNSRGRTPAADNRLNISHVSYPEAGVLRLSCGWNTKAWSDQAIAPTEFRRTVRVE
jgi:hypothetical protein